MKRERKVAARRALAGQRAPVRRRVWIVAGAAVVLLAAAIVWSRSGMTGMAPKRRPNVLLITVDTLRWDRIGAYGRTPSPTPALDALASRGTRFQTAIAHAPLTAPSHASFLTGLVPPRHGVRDNGAFVLPPDLPSLAGLFRQAGYRTAGFISGFPLDRRFGFSGGFDRYDDHLPRGSERGRPAGTERRADVTTDRAIEWLLSGPVGIQSGDSRWFAWIHYFDPHAPYDPPARVAERFPDDPYSGEIAFVDEQIGRLVGRLESAGGLADTVVLVTADHGESLGEHGEETHGVFVYDATIRIPLMVAGPQVSSHRVSPVIGRGVDIMPTLLDLAGIPIPDALDGRSLKPALQGTVMATVPAYMEALLSERHLGWAPLHALRDDGWKYIDAPVPELYDMRADSGERENRASQEPDRAGAFSRRLAEELNASNAAPGAVRPDRATAERLAALGYLSGGRQRASGSSGRDPKSGILVINRLEHAIAQIRIDPRAAAGALRRLLAEEPDIPLARAQLAVALSAAGDHAGTIDELRHLHARREAEPGDLLLLSESLRALGRREEATRALEQAAALDPRSPEPAVTAARAAMAAGNADAAAAGFGRALQLAPDNSDALFGLGEVALARGDLAGAVQAFERLAAIDPGDVRTRSRLGMLRGRQGRMADAIQILKQVVAEAPEDWEAHVGLAAALARTGQPGEAIPHFERAVGGGLRTPAVLNGLGFARLESGDRGGALAALRASLAADPRQSRIEQVVRELSQPASAR